VISDAPEVLHAAVSACIVARDLPGVVGLHIEGPHIAPARRGAHAARHIRPLDDVTLEGVAALRAAGLSALVTVAAEVVLPEDIARLVRAGAVVSIGHSDGTAAQVAAALAAGATCFTHLFNAMSQMTGRAPGVVGAAINSAAYASIIADGHHVVPEMVMMACRARPVADRMIAVSDAMPTVGGPDHFDLCGDPVRLVDGRLTNPDGTLAGAHLTMAQALHNLIGWGIAPETALRMCRGNPAALLGRADLQGLIRMRAQDLVVLDAEYRVAQVGV
jgi:N-acetylglucosamine-6-phosphate deacetylase